MDLANGLCILLYINLSRVWIHCVFCVFRFKRLCVPCVVA